MATFQARAGCGFSFPRMTMTAYDFSGDVVSLAGSQAAIVFRPYSGGPLTLALASTDVLEAPAIFDWDDSAQTLDIHLSPNQTEAMGVGTFVGAVKILGVPPEDVAHNVESMTVTLELVGA